MLGYGWLNLGSLVLGLIAWIFPVVNLVKFSLGKYKNWIVYSVVSTGSCAVALCMQIYYSNALVKKEDWSALMDTSSAVALVSTVLLFVTVVLNAVTFVIYNRKNPGVL